MTQSYSNSNVGIWAKQDIEQALDRGQLILNFPKNCLQACSYDLRIGTIFRDGQIINDSHSEANKQFIINPGEIISIFTWEELDLPNNVMATAFAINKQSSRGLLVLNPGHIDPGFKGCLTVKAINLRKVPLTISRGAEIFTVVFQTLPKSTTSPYTKNILREERERDFNSIDVEQGTKNLSELVILGKDSPYPTRQEVKEIVLQHWMTWLTLILTFVAALTGILAVVLTLSTTDQNVNQKKSNLENSLYVKKINLMNENTEL